MNNEERHSLTSIFPNAASAAKLGTCYSLGAASLAYCFYVAATEGPALEHHIQVLLCILGGTIGWCIGMYLTPSSEGETKKFAEFGKVAVLIGAGVGIAKAPDLLEFVRPIPGSGATTASSLRFLLFFCSLLIFGTATYVGRLHVRGADDERAAIREKVLAEVRKSLDTLSKLN